MRNNSIQYFVHTLTAVLLFTTALCTAFAATSNNVRPPSGDWTVSLRTSETSATVTLSMQAHDWRLTGTSDSSHLGKGTIEGTWSKETLTVTIKSPHATLVLNGTMKNDNKIIGTFTIPDGGMEGTFEGERAAATGTATAPGHS